MAESESRNLQAAQAILGALTESERVLNELRHREDEFTLWIVGLSTGSIGLTSLVEKFSGRWAFISLLFFVLAVVLGVVHRWVLSRVVTATRLAFVEQRTQLSVAITLGDEKVLAQAIQKAYDYSSASYALGQLGQQDALASGSVFCARPDRRSPDVELGMPLCMFCAG